MRYGNIEINQRGFVRFIIVSALNSEADNRVSEGCKKGEAGAGRAKTKRESLIDWSVERTHDRMNRAVDREERKRGGILWRKEGISHSTDGSH